MKFIRTIVQWFKNLELARKLILINFILILIPLCVLGSFAYTSFTRTMEDNVGDFQLQTLKQVTLNIDTYMNELNRLTLMPYQYEEILDYLESDRDDGKALTLSEIDQLNNFVSKVSLNGRIDILGVSLYGEHGASYVVLPESQYVSTYKLDESAEWLKKAQGRFGQPTFITTHELKSTSGTIYKVFSIARELRSFDTGQRLGYIVIDIDPSLEVEPRIMEAVAIIGDILDSLNIASIPKTSGATGVQIYIPIQPRYTFQQLRDLGQFIGKYVTEKHPQLFTIERLKKDRGDRIYFDYLQHWMGKTLSAPYTPRARAGATVSTPLLWEEVRQNVNALDYNLLTIESRLSRYGDLIELVPQQSLDHVFSFIKG